MWPFVFFLVITQSKRPLFPPQKYQGNCQLQTLSFGCKQETDTRPIPAHVPAATFFLTALITLCPRVLNFHNFVKQPKMQFYTF